MNRRQFREFVGHALFEMGRHIENTARWVRRQLWEVAFWIYGRAQ